MTPISIDWLNAYPGDQQRLDDFIILPTAPEDNFDEEQLPASIRDLAQAQSKNGEIIENLFKMYNLTSESDFSMVLYESAANLV